MKAIKQETPLDFNYVAFHDFSVSTGPLLESFTVVAVYYERGGCEMKTNLDENIKAQNSTPILIYYANCKNK